MTPEQKLHVLLTIGQYDPGEAYRLGLEHGRALIAQLNLSESSPFDELDKVLNTGKDKDNKSRHNRFKNLEIEQDERSTEESKGNSGRTDAEPSKGERCP